jgi:two-component system sensor histidine kinase/response regulator
VGDPSTVADLERRLAEKERSARELADSERLYRGLFEGTATAVTIRSLEDQSFVDCNPATLRLYGAETVDQLRGSTIGDLSAELQPDGTPSVEALRRHVELAVRNGSARCEWLARRLDGDAFIADVRIAVLELEGGRRVMQTIIEDITERKFAETALERRAARDKLFARISQSLIEDTVENAIRFAVAALADFLGIPAESVETVLRSPISRAAPDTIGDDAGLVALVREMVMMARARADAEAALRSGEERYRSLVERSQDAIFSLDSAGKIVFASPAAEHLFGYSTEEWLGMEAETVVIPEELKRLEISTAAARRGIPGLPEQWSLRHKNGSIVRIEAARSPIHDHAGALIGAQVIARDVSERHRAEQMREAAARELSRAREDAVAASRAKSAFVANMSHELRTPLNGVIGMVDLLAQTELDTRQMRYVDVARSSASLLLSVINDILDFSKIEAGKLEFERIAFSLSDLVEEVATMMELAAEDKGLELTCQTEAALVSPLVGDPARARQVLVNLINNAIKFTAGGEIAVRTRLIGGTGDRVHVRVEVRDTGVGISLEAQRNLFQPFSQVDASTTRKHGGTGLGLAICRELVQRMGGQIGVESTPGGGSTFWFTLDLERPAAGSERAPLADARLTGLRVLAVDDNATNREILRAQLVAAGTRCEVASSGREALASLTAAAKARDPFVLAVLDQHMPEMDGFELARRIKGAPETASTRLIMIGSIGRPLDPRELQALGVLTWATKPIWRSQLLRALATALDGAAVERAPKPESASSRVAAAASPTYAPQPKRVLLVEDTPISAEVVTEILRSAGYVVELAVDGLQAVDAARRHPFDVILMDCQLPGLDGYEAARRIRALESTAALTGEKATRVPILALTASASVEDKERARLAGMDDHIAKPVDARRLLAAIAQRDFVSSRPRPDADPTDAPAVDLECALGRLQDNRLLLARMVEQFDGEVALARASLRDALTRRDADAVRYAAHRLRGQALSLEALPLAAALGKLEDAAPVRVWNVTSEAFERVDREIDRVVTHLRRP